MNPFEMSCLSSLPGTVFDSFIHTFTFKIYFKQTYLVTCVKSEIVNGIIENRSH